MKTSAFRCASLLAVLLAPPILGHSFDTRPQVLAAPSQPQKLYRKVRGQVRGLSPARGGERASVQVSHENIPGFMPAMTMDMPLGIATDAKRLKKGDKVQFDFVLRRGTYVMENIKILPRSTKLKLRDSAHSMHFVGVTGISLQDPL